jgi:hypothetical protein
MAVPALLLAGLVAGCSLLVSEERKGGVCGDGHMAPPEQCDGLDFGSQTCQDFNGAGSTGVLHCNGDCEVETHECTGGSVCGNAICETGERDTTCPPDCWLSACGDGQCQQWENSEICPEDCGGAPFCGNGLAEEAEECDGGDLRAAVCNDFGFQPGDLSCFPNCTLNLSECGPLLSCGNETVNPPEFCDGMDLQGQSCNSLGFDYGPLGCFNCEFEVSGCVPPLRLPDGGNCSGQAVCIGDTCLHDPGFSGFLMDGYCSHHCSFNVCPGGGVCIVDGPGGNGPLCYEACQSSTTCQNGLACAEHVPGTEKICWLPP